MATHCLLETDVHGQLLLQLNEGLQVLLLPLLLRHVCCSDRNRSGYCMLILNSTANYAASASALNVARCERIQTLLAGVVGLAMCSANNKISQT
jgi:hypothetical protein